MRWASLWPCVLSLALAMRASGVREESTDLITSCQKRVDMVLDGPYGTWFDKKIEALLVNDPFVTLQRGDTKEDLMKRLRSSMLFHCKFFQSQKSCDGIRIARFQERMKPNDQRVFPRKISPYNPSCSKTITNPGPERDRCVIVDCYRELVEKNCQATVPRQDSEVKPMPGLHKKCL
eukprot:symbB.v1.2.032441.t1/scaffold3895.1/size70954/8